MSSIIDKIKQFFEQEEQFMDIQDKDGITYRVNELVIDSRIEKVEEDGSLTEVEVEEIIMPDGAKLLLKDGVISNIESIENEEVEAEAEVESEVETEVEAEAEVETEEDNKEVEAEAEVETEEDNKEDNKEVEAEAEVETEEDKLKKEIALLKEEIALLKEDFTEFKSKPQVEAFSTGKTINNSNPFKKNNDTDDLSAYFR